MQHEPVRMSTSVNTSFCQIAGGSIKSNLVTALVLTFTTQSWFLTALKEKTFEITVGKGGNAGNQHFLIFLQCFLLRQNSFSTIDFGTSPNICRLLKSWLFLCYQN